MKVLDNGILRDATSEEVAEITARSLVPAPVPQTVTARQAKQQLMLASLLDLVPEKIAALSDPLQRAMATIEWESSQVFTRDRPLVIAIGAALGLDAAGLDDLFRKASEL